MEMEQLETIKEIQANRPLNTRFLEVLSNANPILAEDEVLLLSYYKQVKNTWSTSAIKSLQKSQGLKLTSKLNRCRFALAAAKVQLQFTNSDGEVSNNYVAEPENLLLEPELVSESLIETDNLITSSFSVESLETTEELQIAKEQIKLLKSQLQEKEAELLEYNKQLKQSKNFSVLLLTHRILAPGLPLNGTEKSPAMMVLGSPKTRTELEANYRELIKREHPDVSPFPQDIAIERFAFVRSLYRITRMNWTVLKPTAVINKEDLVTRMNAAVPFEPESFWDS